MIWEVEIRPAQGETDREGLRLVEDAHAYHCDSIREVATARCYLLETELGQIQIEKIAKDILVDPIADEFSCQEISQQSASHESATTLVNVLYRPGMTDSVAETILAELQRNGHQVSAVRTCRRYWINAGVKEEQLKRFAQKVLGNEAIERIVYGPLKLNTLRLGHEYQFKLGITPILGKSADELIKISQQGMLSLSLDEMQQIQQHYVGLNREPTDVELETVAQTWSEHCSHKTLAGRITYTDGQKTIEFKNMLKETIFAATQEIRRRLGDKDWCKSVFQDNAGVVTFNENVDVCIKVETHNRPSALEPYGGANTGLGGVIRDSLGTGLGAKPVCSTDVFCFAPFDVEPEDIPKGVLHPRTVARGVVAGVRDYGNRMGIPTVNGAVIFDERYLGNPLVFCGNIATLPRDKTFKQAKQGDYIVTLGGRTGLDGIHGATFSSAVLTEESETTSGGAVQIGNAITEKRVMDALLRARDANLYSAVTDCGAGGFSSAVGEMGEKLGAEVLLDKAPLKYSGLNYTEIWISESQERMVLAVPPENWQAFEKICQEEQVEAAVIGTFTGTRELVLKYNNEVVGNLSMEFLHDGRPKTSRSAKYVAKPEKPVQLPEKLNCNDLLKQILAAPSVASKEWIIRQYDHEVQAGSVIKPLVGVHSDSPGDAAVVMPDLNSTRGIVVSNGINPAYSDGDPYYMAAGAIDESIRNCVSVGADPDLIAILDNFCWGNTNDPECLGELVRTSLGCQETALAFGTPFISGKDSLHNEFKYDANGVQQKIRIPGTLLISALGQIDNVEHAISMDLKSAENLIYLVGETFDELGGSHLLKALKLSGGHFPKVNFANAKANHHAVARTIKNRLVRSCHDLSEGGLAVAITEMAFAGELGVTIDLSALIKKTGLSPETILFSESHSRYLVEVSPSQKSSFELELGSVPFYKIGTVNNSRRVIIQDHHQQKLIDEDLATLKHCWKHGLQF